MAVEYETFIVAFPEFASTNPLVVENAIEQVTCETCGYAGFSQEKESDLAVSLHVAHVLTFYNQTQSKFDNGRKTKKYKTKQDEIEFFEGDPMSPFGMLQTQYGARLQSMIKLLYVPFCL